MSTNECFTISEKKKEIDQLRASMSPDVDKEMYNDTYQIYLILKEHNFDVNEAEVALRRILNWKKKLQLDKYDEGNIPEIIKKYFDKHLIGFNKENGPVHYFPFGKFDSRGICSSVRYTDLEKFYADVLEKDLQIQRKKKLSDGSYPCTFVIFDMDGLSFANATNKKGKSL
ncbi:SEC14-like protein 2 [Trichonephila inaurata madagascariensis]|uniref:SEC14-like protein 2 n=1 Tax=Trichonephila inaurata madagascariensis TaxID=2747483 RepID=A0A8X6XTD9_9ARAC|nr:SEC14-like protein 2 [Trichonephila inaurata madagascariensis]